MKATFTIEELIKATGAKLISGEVSPHQVFMISTDTREIIPGAIYLPLSGKNFDGHNFIEDAIDRGATGFFSLKDKYRPSLNENIVLEVEDTLLTLLSLANYNRKRLNATVIAITGSSGKTTTKEMVFSVLKEKFNTQKSSMNFNNEIGVSQTLLNIDEDTRYVILEMGMRGLGEIDILAKYAEPDISIITNVGSSHIGRLGSIENIAIAKTEILKYLDKEKGLAFLNADDSLLLSYSSMTYNGKVILFGEKRTILIHDCDENEMVFNYKDRYYKLTIPGKHNAINASCAIELGYQLGMNYEEIYNGLKKYSPLFGRWEEFQFNENSLIINDAYNANPESLKAAVDTVIDSYQNKNIWLVLGDMFELGEFEESLHKNIGQWLKNKKVDLLLTAGKLAKLIGESLDSAQTEVRNFEDIDSIAKFIINKKPKDTVILLKASRGVGLEKVLEKMGISNVGSKH